MFDGQTIALNTKILIPTGLVEAGREGLYKVTTLWAGGVALVLTRDTSCDTAAEILNTRFQILTGARNRTRTYVCTSAPGSIDGATSIGIVCVSQADGVSERVFRDDFLQTGLVATSGQTNLYALSFTATNPIPTGAYVRSGTATTDGKFSGIMEISPGTTNTGDMYLFNNTSLTLPLWDVAAESWGRWRFLIPTLSINGSSHFDIRADFGNSGTVEGLRLIVDGADNHLKLVLFTSSTPTTVDLTGAAIAANTVYDVQWFKFAGTRIIHVYVNGVLCTGAGASTGLPSQSAVAGLAIRTVANTTGTAANKQSNHDLIEVGVRNPKAQAA